MNRRSLLKWVVHGVSLAVITAITVPAAILGFSPLWKRRPNADWRPLRPTSHYPVGQVHETQVSRSPHAPHPRLTQRTVYIFRPSDDQFIAFSRNCTDLGCPVNFDPGSQCFFCPCHGGIFNKNGQRLAGPPPRPLDRYATRIRDGILEIDLASLPLAAG